MAANPQDTKTIDKRKQGVPLNTYIPYAFMWLKSELEAIAAQDNRSVSEIVVTALVEFVEKRRNKKK